MTTPASVMRRVHRDQSGSVSSEHVATIVIVAAVIAAILVIPLAPTIGSWGQYAVCQLFGGECQRPGLDEQLELASCETSQQYSYLEYNVGAFSLSYSNEVGFETTVDGNGDIEVSYVRGQDAGASAGIGAEVWIYAGDDEIGGGARASASIDVLSNEGDVYGFSDMEEAEEYIAWTTGERGVIDTVPLVGSDTPGIGWAAEKVHEGVNWGLNQFGWGHEPPPEPEVIGSWEEGGLELSGRGRAGVRDGSGAVDAGVEAIASEAEKHYVDHRTGETTLYLTTGAFIDGGGELGPVGVDFTAGDESVVAVTVDEDGEPTELTTHSYRLADAGQDLSQTTDRDAIDRSFGTAGLSEALEEPSMYEATTSLDLEDDPDLADAMLGGGPPPSDAEIEDLADEQAAVTTVAEYDVDNPRYGFRANLGKALEYSGGVSSGTDRSSIQDAWVYDPASGSYERWMECADAG